MPIRTIADIETIEAQPLADRCLPRTTYEALAEAARRTPDAKALSFFLTPGTYDHVFTWSYAELLAEVTRAANAFHAWGVRAGHPVAFVLPNLPETHFTIWGGEAAGAVFAINHLLEPSSIADLLRATRTRVLVTLTPGPGIDPWTRMMPNLQNLPDLQVVALVDPSAYTEGAAAARRDKESDGAQTGLRFVDFRRALQKQPSDRLLSPRPNSESSTSSYACTGGTTGAPKIAVRTHGNEVFDAWATAQMLGSSDEQRVYFCGLPLFHSNAQIVTGLMPWMQGDHVVLGGPEGYRDKGLMSHFWEIMAHFRVSMFSGVPTIYASLLDLPVEDHDISSLEFALCGAAPMSAKLIESFEATTGVRILEGYGLTEGTCVSSVNPAKGERRAGSIGMRIPYQQMQAVILDDVGRFLRMAQTDEVGVLAIRGPNVFSGYLDAGHDGGVWIEIDGETWLNTGDLGRQDKQGRFWHAGRRKELIIRGGHNIDPKLIEDALIKHPDVALVAGVGSPDPHVGEVPVAYVQMRPGATATERELLDFAGSCIPERAAVPKRIVVLPVLPMTGVGKIFKPALQELEIEAAILAEAQRTGAVIVQIEHIRDRWGAHMVLVRADGDAAALRSALEHYAFKSEVSEGAAAPRAAE